MGIYVELSDDLILTSDERQFILNRVSVSGKDSKIPGVKTLRPYAYFGDIVSMLKCIPQRSLMASDCKTLKECKDLLASFMNMLESELRGYDIQNVETIESLTPEQVVFENEEVREY